MSNDKKFYTTSVSALFVREDSIYKNLGVDCWDIERNALNWPGGNPIIAHPPCRAWGQLAHLAKPREGEKELAIWAIGQIRRWGGVLEHPRSSKLWKEMNLPIGIERDEYGGFSMSVDQNWWGHKARKRTLLYFCGCDPGDIPAHPLTFTPYTHVISGSRGRNKLPELGHKAREATPEAFAKWLIEAAKKCSKNLNIKQ